MIRLGHFAFGVAAYLLFNVVFIYLIGFLANFQVPRAIASSPPGEGMILDLSIDALLLWFFALHHSVAARPWYKRWLTRRLPAHLERSVYVLSASVVLALVLWWWRAVPVEIWRVENPWLAYGIRGVFGMGVVISLAATFQIDHYELFGLRQVYRHLHHQPETVTPFQERGLYGVVRQPIMLGTLIVLWSTPAMTLDHLLLAGILSGYILVGIRLEERDLSASLGEPYQDYRKRIPMIIPGLKRKIAR